jgi:light-regulated signal transduction histidine kinase (bacteriophytochrome)
MTLEQRLSAVFQQIGDDVQALLAQDGNLANLSTTAKGSLVAAINEVLTVAQQAGQTATGLIDDTATTSATKVWSITKLTSELAALKSDILGGVPATAFDTIKEIADYIASDATLGTQLVDGLSKRVRFDATQSLTLAEKSQARQNIDAYGSVELGNPDANLLSIYNTAKTT